MTEKATLFVLRTAALGVLCGLCAVAAGARQTARHTRPTSGAPRASQTSDVPAASGRLKTYALRLTPGQDLRRELESFAQARRLRAGIVLTAVGSLSKAALRLADKSEATAFEGKFEIVSLVGTLSPDGVHLHASLSDGEGRTVGGHLVEGCTVYTTVELAVGEIEGVRFAREQDARTGYKELRVYGRAARKAKR